MNYRKILSMLLAIMMLLCSVSCGIIVVHDISDESQILPSNNNYGSDSSESVRDESNSSQNQYDKIDDGRTMSEEFLTEIGRHDFEDASITIFTTTDTYFRPSDDESVFSGLIRERQKKVQDMLGVTIKYEVVEQNSMLSRAVQAKAAGESECDIRMVPVYSLGGFGLKGVLADFNLLPSIDLSKPYFNESSIAASTFVSATYGVAGDAVLTPDIYTAVFMNKDLIKNAGLDPMRLYSLVNDGMWTWERMLVVGTTSKINYDIKSYLVTGSVTHRFPDIVFKSFGNDFISSNYDMLPELGFTPDSSRSVMDVLKLLYDTSECVLDSPDTAVSSFKKDESIFLVDSLSAISELSDLKSSWGILPLPKSYDAEEYRTLVDNNSLLFTVSDCSPKTEMACLTISALNAASHGYFRELYVDEIMQNMLWDHESVNMLDMILDTAVFDMAFALGNSLDGVADATYKLVRGYMGDIISDEVYDKAAELANEAFLTLLLPVEDDETEETTESVESDEPEDTSETKPEESN